MFATTGVPQILLIGYIVVIRAKPTPGEFGIRWPGKADVLVALLGASALLVVFLGLALVVQLFPEPIRSGVEPSFVWTWNLPKGYVLPFALITGYREELFFRAYLLTRIISAGASPMLAVCAASVLFALGHVYQGPLAVTFALMQAVGFSLLFLRTKRLHGLAWAHGIYNAAVLLAVTSVP